MIQIYILHWKIHLAELLNCIRYNLLYYIPLIYTSSGILYTEQQGSKAMLGNGAAMFLRDMLEEAEKKADVVLRKKATMVELDKQRQGLRQVWHIAMFVSSGDDRSQFCLNFHSTTLLTRISGLKFVLVIARGFFMRADNSTRPHRAMVKD